MNYNGMEMPLKEPPSEYAKRSCYYGASFPSAADLAGIEQIGEDHVLWGNDYPHYEGTFPYNLESLRLTFGSHARRAPAQGAGAERRGALQLRPRGVEGSGGKSRPDPRAGGDASAARRNSAGRACYLFREALQAAA